MTPYPRRLADDPKARPFASGIRNAPPGQVRSSAWGGLFPDDDARRSHFLARLREHLLDPGFRQVEGFPLGEVEDILALSDPPYFTACPNPFLKDVIAHHGRPYDPEEPYHSEPFALDVAAGKNDTIYMAHSYHTKVPHQAILRYILHYTRPGDLILDGFCGSGMTGVAASLCEDLPPDEKAAIEQEMPGVQWGRRIAILNDLSPLPPSSPTTTTSGWTCPPSSTTPRP